MKIRLSKEQPLTKDVLVKILELHRADEARKEKLSEYYVGEQAINLRTMSDSSKPNNRLVHPYGNYITDSVVGYFMGQPVSYAAKEPEFEQMVAALKDIFNYNDEQSENVELAKDASKYGVAYELIYVDEAANTRFKFLDPRYCVPVIANTLDEELIYFIRYYSDDIMDPTKIMVEVYDSERITYFRKNNGEVSYMGEQLHSFGMVPVSIYYNNQEEKGDYELVVSLIDAYDKLNSDSVNDFEQFADAYLTLKGMDGTTSDDIATMKENRVLLLPQEGSADWLVKTINDTYFHNTITTIDADIHKFSKVPDMMDEAFGSNLSGIAIKYKLIALENKVAIKEAYFKKGLQRRIELINRIQYLLGSEYDYMGVEIKFHRNLPVNELEAVQMANQISGLVSDETMLSILPFVEDAKMELEKRDAQLDFSVEPIINVENDGSEA